VVVSSGLPALVFSGGYDPNQDTEGGALGFNPSFHNPYGRYLQLSVTYKFK